MNIHLQYDFRSRTAIHWLVTGFVGIPIPKYWNQSKHEQNHTEFHVGKYMGHNRCQIPYNITTLIYELIATDLYETFVVKIYCKFSREMDSVQ